MCYGFGGKVLSRLILSTFLLALIIFPPAMAYAPSWQKLTDDGKVLEAAGKYDQAEAKYKEALRLAEKSQKTNTVNLARSYFNLGDCLRAETKYKESQEHLARAYQLAEKVKSFPPVEMSAVMNALADVDCLLEKYNEAIEIYKKEESVLDKVHGNKTAALIDHYDDYALALYGLKRNDEAEQMHRKAQRVRHQALHR